MLEPVGFNYTENRESNLFYKPMKRKGALLFRQYAKNVEILKRFRSLLLLYIIHFKSQVHQNRFVDSYHLLPVVLVHNAQPPLILPKNSGIDRANLSYAAHFYPGQNGISPDYSGKNTAIPPQFMHFNYCFL